MSEESDPPFEIPTTLEGEYVITPELFFAKNDKGDTLWTKFLSLYLAMVLEENKGPFFALTPDSDLYRYDSQKGYWLPDGIKTIQESVQKYLDSFTTVHRVNETIAAVRRRNYLDPALVNPNPTNLETIVVANGVLNLKTHSLGLFDPEMYALNAFDITFDPAAECPTILKFLEEITSDAQDLATLQEWFGYHLWRKYMIHKALMLIGEGSNGKTTLLNLLITFIGEENCSFIELHELSADRFAAADLFGKLANIADDISVGEIKFTGKFKKLTGESGIRTQFKNQTSFNFYNIAKASFSANQLPSTTDLTKAFFRRWIILKFTKTFENENCDKQLLSKLTTPEELSGLLTWSLHGLTRLLTNMEFSLSTSAEVTKEEWKIQSNPIAHFVHERLEILSEGVTPRSEMFAAYLNFCYEQDYKTLSTRAFSSRLRESAPKIKERKRSIDKKTTRCWLGVELKEPNEENDRGADKSGDSEDDPPPTGPQTEITNFGADEAHNPTPDSYDLEKDNMEGRGLNVSQVPHGTPQDNVPQTPEREEESISESEKFELTNQLLEILRNAYPLTQNVSEIINTIDPGMDQERRRIIGALLNEAKERGILTRDYGYRYGIIPRPEEGEQ